MNKPLTESLAAMQQRPDRASCPGPGSQHRYPRAALLSDLLRGLSGLLVCTMLIVIAQPAAWLVFVLTAAMVLFVTFLLRVVNRCRGRIEMDADSLRVFAAPDSDTAVTCLDWKDLDRLDLDYFCTRRDGQGGWLQLRLRAGRSSVRLDSRLSGFERVVARAVDAAHASGVALSATTASNLAASGFEDGRAEVPSVAIEGNVGEDHGAELNVDALGSRR